MAKPVVISLSSIVHALSEAPQSTSAIAEKAGASRAAVHRKLVKLVGNGLVLHACAGKNSTYRLASAEEEFTRARAVQVTTGKSIRLAMNGQMAASIQACLEVMTRIGIGQFEDIIHNLRWESFGPEKRFSIEQIENAAVMVQAMKLALLDLESNASHGIFSVYNHPDIFICWDLNKMIRHRLAWDHTPSGAMGVSFDEPMSTAGSVKAIFTRVQGDVQEQGEKSYVLEVDVDLARILIRSLRFQSRLANGDISVVVDFAAEGMVKNNDGEVVAKKALDAALDLAREASRMLDFDREKKTSLALAYEYAADVIESVVSGRALLSVAKSPFGSEGSGLGRDWRLSVSASDSTQTDENIVGLKDLPAGHFVKYGKTGYRVIGPCTDPNYLSVLSESHSVQTAIIKALNRINNTPRSI